MSEPEPEFDIELETVLCAHRPNTYILLSKGDGKPVAAFSESREGRHTFIYFCHGLAVRGSFRVWRGGKVIAERRPDSCSGVGWFDIEGGLPCNPNNPF